VLDETYHSRHGAVQESLYVFINNGLNYFIDTSPDASATLSIHSNINKDAERSRSIHNQEINILEIGFGTGLNALLTCIAAEQLNCNVSYDALEAFPLNAAIIARLNYATQVADGNNYFEKLHNPNWDVAEKITEKFWLTKISTSVQCFVPYKNYDLIFFDAFAPRVQPEMWTQEIFGKMHTLLNTGGTLVTYCAKGDVRRAMQSAGFKTEKLQGPPGKREMLRAIKL
jgi:tRNA U34 5-methylaminomethyl-2-thiouridine-forming methyltransferase MnmC